MKKTISLLIVLSLLSSMALSALADTGPYTVPMQSLGTSAAAVEECPVERIDFEPLQIIERTGGYITSDYNWETSSYGPEYYQYSINPSYTVYLKDGSTRHSEDGYTIEYNGEYYWLNVETDQSYENQWGVGSHTVQAKILGFQTQFTVEIIECPVERIEFEPLQIIENTSGCMTSDYNWETSSDGPEYYYYYINPSYTVFFKDGSSIRSEAGDSIEYEGEWYSLSMQDDQSYENQWGVGSHTVQADILGFQTEFTVEIIECPVERIEFEPVQLFEGYDGTMWKYYNPDNEEYDQYFRYNYCSRYADDYNLISYTVHLKNGKILQSDKDGTVKYNGLFYMIFTQDDQSYEHPWGLGTHTVQAEVMGFQTEFTVNIAKPLVIDGVTYSTDQKVLLDCDPEKSGSFDMPESVTEIAPEAFLDCTKLTDIKVSPNVTQIVYATFANCASLTSVELPKTLKSIGVCAFSGCTSLQSVQLPEELEEIGYYAFVRCSNLQQIQIPASVSKIGEEYIFAMCTELTEIEVDPANPYYQSIDGVLFNKAGTELIWCPKRSDSYYAVPEKVEKILSGAFGLSGVSHLEILNPKTYFEKFSVGYNNELDAGFVSVPVTLICAPGSSAASYAAQNKLQTATLSSVTIETQPNKMVYTVGQSFNPAGLTLKAEYSDGFSRTVSSGFTVGDFDSSETGQKTVSISYAGQTVSVTVAVIDAVTGDLDGDDVITTDDGLRLAYHILLGGDDYTVNQDCDFNKDGKVNTDDAIYLVYHVLLPDRYPL